MSASARGAQQSPAAGTPHGAAPPQLWRRTLLSVCRRRRLPLGLRRRLGRWTVPYSDHEYELTIDGVAYRGRLDNYIDWIAYVTGQFYEFSYLNLVKRLELEGCALDVGANVGNHAAALSGMFDEVLAFEPYRPLFDRLQAKTKLLGVRAFPIGLGDADGELPFAPPKGRNLGKGRVKPDGEVSVPIVRGDRFLAAHAERDIGFIKVDVEGFESEVLRGLHDTIRRCRPVVMYEVAHKFRRRPAGDDGFSCFPADYEFLGLKGQSTFPLQRQVARPRMLRGGALGRRHTYVVACPAHRVARLRGEGM